MTKSVELRASQSGEGCFDLLAIARQQNLHLPADGPRCRLHVSRFRLRVRVVGIDEQAERMSLRRKLAQQRHALCSQHPRDHGRAGGIAARPIKAGDQARPDRIVAGQEYDRDRRGAPFGNQGRYVAAGGKDHRHATAKPRLDNRPESR